MSGSRSRAGRLAARLSRRARHDDVDALRRRLDRLHAQVAALEAEIAEERRLHRRVAELTDAITQLVLPATERDEQVLARLLDEHADEI